MKVAIIGIVLYLLYLNTQQPATQSAVGSGSQQEGTSAANLPIGSGSGGQYYYTASSSSGPTASAVAEPGLGIYDLPLVRGADGRWMFNPDAQYFGYTVPKREAMAVL